MYKCVQYQTPLTEIGKLPVFMAALLLLAYRGNQKNLSRMPKSLSAAYKTKGIMELTGTARSATVHSCVPVTEDRLLI